MRSRAAAVGASIVALGGLAGAVEHAGGLGSGADGASSRLQGLTGLPLPAQAMISGVLGRDDHAYGAVARGAVVRVVNRRHGLAARFGARGVRVQAGEASVLVSLRAVGYGASLRAVGAAAPRARSNRVEYRRRGLTEWYVNGPQGLEQGFTLAHPPGRRDDGPLTLSLAVSGGLKPRLERDRRGVTLAARGGDAPLAYRGLWASDATGRGLRAWLEPRGRELLVRVNDAGARYPVTVDPFFQAAKLTASDGAAGDSFGRSVDISGDTIVVGASGDDIGANSSQGSVHVFVKGAGGWASGTQTAKLTASDGAAGDGLGVSVAISGDTIVAGAPGGIPSLGSAYVFVKPAGGWADGTQTAKLTAADGTAGDNLGVSVAISGPTIVAGVPDDNGEAGSAYVFVKPAGGWANRSHTAKLTASDATADDRFGGSVAISGNTIVAGAQGDNSGGGSAYVFVKPVSGWIGGTQTAKLTRCCSAADDNFGRVAISGDTIVVGAPRDDVGADDDQGSLHVFVEPPGGWVNAQPVAQLTASDGAAGDQLGSSVAIAGGTIVGGARFDDIAANEAQGRLYVFSEPPGGWVNGTERAQLTASDGAAFDNLGISVGIAGDTVVAGAWADDIGPNDGQGSAYAFVDDNTPPDTTIAAGPSGPNNDNTPSFEFSASEAGSSFQCRVDGGAFAPCSSPHTVAPLSNGPHSFEVRAVDPVGNTDGTPASRNLDVDTTAPDTAISAGPADITSDNTPTFEFSASEPGSSFQCRLDGGPFAPCSSPHAVAPLEDGVHSFDATATDPVGNPDITAASRGFTVDTTPPDTRIGGPTRLIRGESATFTASVTDAGGVGVDPFAVRWTPSDGLPESRGTTVTYTFSAVGSYTIRATAADRAGNTSREATITVTVVHPPLINAGVTSSFDVFRSSRTRRVIAKRVGQLTVTRLPARAGVTVTCKAPRRPRSARRSCAFKRKRFAVPRARRALPLAPLFKRRRLALGTVIQVTITAPARRGKVLSYRITARRTTPGKLTCLTPHGKPAPCHD